MLIFEDSFSLFTHSFMASLPVLVIVVLIFMGFKIVQQGTNAVITAFGEYKKVLRPGLNFIVPFYHSINRRISTQNKSVEMDF